MRAIANYDQATVDRLCQAVAWATANEATATRLAYMGVDESGLGDREGRPAFRERDARAAGARILDLAPAACCRRLRRRRHKLANQTRRELMANRRDLVVEQLRALADDLEELWKAATRDPAAERRKQRGWVLLTGALGALATLASQKALAKLWPILTGEPPPAPKAPGASRQRDRESVS